MDRIGIGHDITDPTKYFHGRIHSLYLWSGEMTPDVAEALVRSEVEPINADTYSPVGPAGSLSLIINTQGTGTSGDRVFTLPASRATVAPTALVVGQQYRILTVGTTNWTLVGAASNTVGAVFVATGTTTGTGTAAWQNDFVVTWGDGTESGLEGADAEGASAKLTKTYASAGIYPIWVSDRLQNLIFNNSTSAPELVRIEAWGTGNMYRRPSTMANAFWGCSLLNFGTAARNPATFPDTSAVTSWANAFRGCSSITGAFPAFNFSAATNFSYAFSGCSSITSWPAVDTQTQFVTNFERAWEYCSSLTSFPLIVTSAGTSFSYTWRGCTGLTSFPLINTGAATSLVAAWENCPSLTSFPLINTAAVSNFQAAWNGCSSLTSFPLINTAAGLIFLSAWDACSGLTSFPLINTAAATNFQQTWRNCSSLSSFPTLNTAQVINIQFAWQNCVALTSFPSLNLSAVTNAIGAWRTCSGLTSFPAINMPLATNIYQCWQACSALTSFPLINLNSVTNASQAWLSCSGLTSFPAIVMPNVTGLAATDSTIFNGFRDTWRSCTNLATFPANMFNTTTCTRFLDAFRDCALTAASIENILVSINTANTSNGNLSLQGGTNAGATTWTANAVTAYNALIARGWTITRNA